MTVCGDRLLPPGHYTHCTSHRTWARLNCSLINTAECRDGTAEMGTCSAVQGCVQGMCHTVLLYGATAPVVTGGGDQGQQCSHSTYHRHTRPSGDWTSSMGTNIDQHPLPIITPSTLGSHTQRRTSSSRNVQRTLPRLRTPVSF